jgi:hypothetical protein
MNLFASADHLVLVADQWPQHGAPASILPQQMAKECQTMSFFARYGYFRTNDLEGKDSVRPRFARLLAYSIALTEAQVSRVEYLTLHEDGQVRPAVDAVKPDGLRFSVTRANGRALTIDYVRTDLSNNGLKAGGRSHTFMRSQMDGVVLLKSASHLLQKSYFSALAELILERAPGVVQDETGLDIEPFRRAFEIRSYGKFHAPQRLGTAADPLFAGSARHRAAALYDRLREKERLGPAGGHAQSALRRNRRHHFRLLVLAKRRLGRAALAQVRVGQPESSQDGDFPTFHGQRLLMPGFVVPALGMQGPVDQQVCVVGRQGLALLPGFLRDHGCAQHHIGHDDRGLRVVKGQHVGRPGFAAIALVERAAFERIDDAHRDLGRCIERVTDAAGDEMAGQGAAMTLGLRDGTKLQRQAQIV